MNDHTLSPLEQAILKRNQNRETWTFEAANFLQKGPPLGKYRMRIATVDEQDNALHMAERHVEEKAKNAGRDQQKALANPDLLNNAKVAYMMHAVCLRVDRDVPAFQSGKWMLENFSTDELAVLLNHYNELLKLRGPIELDMSTERIEGLAALMAAHGNSDIPNIALVAFTREQVAEICVRLSLLLKDARQEIGRLSEMKDDASNRQPE